MKKLIYIAFISFIFSSGLVAQDYGSYSYPGTDFYANNNTINIAVMNEVITKPSRDEKLGIPAISSQSLTFYPSKAQRKKNIAKYIADVAKVAPDYAPQLAAEFADGKMFAQFGQLMDSVGLDANDVGDNLAAWWITAWEASMARSVETPPAAFAKVKEQVRRILSEKALVAMSNVEKQNYADSMTIQTLVLANQIEQAKSNPEIAQKLATGIKAGAKKMGFDLDAMTLTEDGFVPVKKGRKTGDASGVGVGVGADRVMAASKAEANPADDGGDASPNYILFAALGSATLGGITGSAKPLAAKADS
jgi:hypothetical protein